MKYVLAVLALLVIGCEDGEEGGLSRIDMLPISTEVITNMPKSNECNNSFDQFWQNTNEHSVEGIKYQFIEFTGSYIELSEFSGDLGAVFHQYDGNGVFLYSCNMIYSYSGNSCSGSVVEKFISLNTSGTYDGCNLPDNNMHYKILEDGRMEWSSNNFTDQSGSAYWEANDTL